MEVQVKQNTKYQPWVVSTATQQTYNLDKELIETVRPDGKLQIVAYNAKGQLQTQSLVTHAGDTPKTLIHLYDDAGRLSRLEGPDGHLNFSYDGFLLTEQRWEAGSQDPNGEQRGVTGSVQYAYDNQLNQAQISVNHANPIAFAYDQDNLLCMAGNLTLNRDPQTPLCQGSCRLPVTG